MRLSAPLRFAASLAAAVFLWAAAATAGARDRDVGGFTAISPGMTHTDLESVMGPPDYVQVRYMQEAYQYCPGWFDRGPFVTVWFRNFRVEHMRAYPSKHMGRCEDFIAAFRWEDLDGMGGGGPLK